MTKCVLNLRIFTKMAIAPMVLSLVALLFSGVQAAPVGDTEIKKCVVDGLGKSEKLKDQKIDVSVSGGVATITGMAKNPGSKGAITRMAKKCGATDVKNEAKVENPIQRKKKDGTSGNK
ncbi:MAG: BON domain-containing protein [Blastocatellia bacterium]